MLTELQRAVRDSYKQLCTEKLEGMAKFLETYALSKICEEIQKSKQAFN